MKRASLFVALAVVLFYAAPAWAQRGQGGRPAGKGPTSTPGASSSSHGSGASSTAGQPNKSGTSSDTSRSKPTVSDLLQRNTAIAGKIQTLTGQDAQTACSGFKNLGLCVAAAHVAKNLDIPGGFDALKAKLTGPNGENLGKAIHDLKPDADATAEVNKAKRQAREDMKKPRS